MTLLKRIKQSDIEDVSGASALDQEEERKKKALKKSKAHFNTWKRVFRSLEKIDTETSFIGRLRLFDAMAENQSRHDRILKSLEVLDGGGSVITNITGNIFTIDEKEYDALALQKQIQDILKSEKESTITIHSITFQITEEENIKKIKTKLWPTELVVTDGMIGIMTPDEDDIEKIREVASEHGEEIQYVTNKEQVPLMAILFEVYKEKYKEIPAFKLDKGQLSDYATEFSRFMYRQTKRKKEKKGVSGRKPITGPKVKSRAEQFTPPTKEEFKATKIGIKEERKLLIRQQEKLEGDIKELKRKANPHFLKKLEKKWKEALEIAKETQKSNLEAFINKREITSKRLKNFEAEREMDLSGAQEKPWDSQIASFQSEIKQLNHRIEQQKILVARLEEETSPKAKAKEQIGSEVEELQDRLDLVNEQISYLLEHGRLKQNIKGGLPPITEETPEKKPKGRTDSRFVNRPHEEGRLVYTMLLEQYHHALQKISKKLGTEVKELRKYVSRYKNKVDEIEDHIESFSDFSGEELEEKTIMDLSQISELLRPSLTESDTATLQTLFKEVFRFKNKIDGMKKERDEIRRSEE